MNVIFVGDVVGRPGRRMLEYCLAELRERYAADFVVINGENASGGVGLGERSFHELIDMGVDAFTLGNHAFHNREVFRVLDDPRIVRPANWKNGAPGVGWRAFEVAGERLLLGNLLGVTFMAEAENPFLCADDMLAEMGPGNVLIDIHAEATSEKIALGWYLDGRAAAVLGTHTHVQTADARILPKGTAFLTDVGMTGPRDSVLGVDMDIVIRRFKTGARDHFQVAAGDLQFNGVFLAMQGGRAQKIEPINFVKESL